MSDGAVSRALVLEAPRRLVAPVVYQLCRSCPACLAAALDLLASGKCPFESLPRRCMSLDDAEDLLATAAGDRDGVPPVDGVPTP
jgi:hypothetical protein